MTRKEFTLTVVEELKKNPRAVLAGHGISAAVLQTIVQREDVMFKLATILYSTVYAKKGAPGLKKAGNFKLTGYKNFTDFNMKAREDVETFIGGLSPDDASKFKNSDNILVILLQPETTVGEDDLSITEIIGGKSIALTFDTAVKKEYKVPGGMYLTVMVGDSAAKPVEVAIAERKSKVNKAKQAKRTPGKIIQELNTKASTKLAIIKKKGDALLLTARTAELELAQFKSIGEEFGVKGGYAPRVIGGINNFNKSVEEVKGIVASLDAEHREYFDLAVKYKKAGNEKMAKAMLKALGNEALTGYVNNGAPENADSVIKNRKIALKAEIARLDAKGETLLDQLTTETDKGKRLSIRSMISKNSKAVREARMRLGTYKNISVNGMKKKAELLKQANAAMEANIAAGNNIKEALNLAIAGLGIKPAEEVLIKQQVMQQVADGTPMQFAVQQAIQENIQEIPQMSYQEEFVAEQVIPDMNDDILGSSLSGSMDIKSLLANL